MWKEDIFGITDISIALQSIHVAVKVTSPLLLGSLVLSMLVLSLISETLWDQLTSLANSIESHPDTNWLVGGHFNEVLLAHTQLEILELTSSGTASIIVTWLTLVLKVVSILGQIKDIEIGITSSSKELIDALQMCNDFISSPIPLSLTFLEPTLTTALS